MKKLVVIFLMGLSFILGTQPVVDAMESSSIDYSAYEKILNENVNAEGLVNYKNILADHSALDIFITTQIESADISALSDDELKAFWINAYNALTLKLIVNHYPPPLGQIRGINWGRPWDVKMRAAGREITLNEIEHEILRKWDPIDPRIHFAINCASIGCPKLPNTHFAPATLEEQLDKESRRFNNDPEKVRLDRKKNRLYYSSIYKWFEEDFVAQHGDLFTYIVQYINEDDKAYLLANKDKIKLKALKYDWGLNKQ